MSLRDTLEQVKAQTGNAVGELGNPVLLRWENKRSWEWFLELSSRRGTLSLGMSATRAPLTFQDLAAWAAFTGNRPSHLEKSVLLVFDTIFLQVMAD